MKPGNFFYEVVGDFPISEGGSHHGSTGSQRTPEQRAKTDEEADEHGFQQGSNMGRKANLLCRLIRVSGEIRRDVRFMSMILLIEG